MNISNLTAAYTMSNHLGTAVSPEPVFADTMATWSTQPWKGEWPSVHGQPLNANLWKLAGFESVDPDHPSVRLAGIRIGEFISEPDSPSIQASLLARDLPMTGLSIPSPRDALLYDQGRQLITELSQYAAPRTAARLPGGSPALAAAAQGRLAIRLATESEFADLCAAGQPPASEGCQTQCLAIVHGGKAMLVNVDRFFKAGTRELTLAAKTELLATFIHPECREILTQVSRMTMMPVAHLERIVTSYMSHRGAVGFGNESPEFAQRLLPPLLEGDLPGCLRAFVRPARLRALQEQLSMPPGTTSAQRKSEAQDLIRMAVSLLVGQQPPTGRAAQLQTVLGPNARRVLVSALYHASFPEMARLAAAHAVLAADGFIRKELGHECDPHLIDVHGMRLQPWPGQDEALERTFTMTPGIHDPGTVSPASSSVASATGAVVAEMTHQLRGLAQVLKDHMGRAASHLPGLKTCRERIAALQAPREFELRRRERAAAREPRVHVHLSNNVQLDQVRVELTRAYQFELDRQGREVAATAEGKKEQSAGERPTT